MLKMIISNNLALHIFLFIRYLSILFFQSQYFAHDEFRSMHFMPFACSFYNYFPYDVILRL